MSIEKIKEEIENAFAPNYQMQLLVNSFNKKHLKADEWMHQNFCSIWTSLESTGGIYKKKRLFQALRKCLPEKNKGFLSNKADENGFLTLYRGTGIHPFNQYETDYACSYTYDINKARYFAKRFLCLHKTGFIIQRKVHLNQVVAYINERKEKEVVIIPNIIDVFSPDFYKVIEVLKYVSDGKADVAKVNITINNCDQYNWDIVNWRKEKTS